jgi:hypothetical protein
MLRLCPFKTTVTGSLLKFSTTHPSFVSEFNAARLGPSESLDIGTTPRSDENKYSATRFGA